MMMKKLEKVYEEFQDLHQQIMAKTAVADRKQHNEFNMQFDALHDETATALETWLEMLSQLAEKDTPFVTERGEVLVILATTDKSAVHCVLVNPATEDKRAVPPVPVNKATVDERSNSVQCK
ncbi:hypothetical protein pipiens_016875 [Culex pipiens pipiens]|uniref:Uncharacterized protein n=1 Tax=Culex pipiens pipiens TaxID=38569 RepID=A0ABD1CJK1_CULPP